MSSGGPKMVERSYGVALSGRKMDGNHKNPVTKWCSRSRFAGQIPARPEAVGREILKPTSSGGGAPHGPVLV